MEWYCDRRAWMVAVEADRVRWGFKGIANASEKAFRSSKENQLVLSMLDDDQFMERRMYDEVKYVAECSDWDDDWERAARWKIEKRHCCTEGDECEDFKTELAALLENEDARWEWANEHVEWEWIRETTIECNSGEGLWYGLKEHPVEEVYSTQREKWLDLSEVVGYCPNCDEPLTKDNLGKEKEIHNLDLITPHPFSLEHCECDENHLTDGYMHCAFDKNAQRRPMFECTGCYYVDALDDIDGTFINRHKRPFNWPPGAPFPPRRHFDGTWLNPSPKEDL